MNDTIIDYGRLADSACEENRRRGMEKIVRSE
ncbi:hypothetical protein BPC006_II0814 [Burkholderia pseudomallei BPC006]|nr:hypothetical protein BPC006_II0814 [Burkholderia pseudomallei BPC006]